jgi:exopolysaccharide biosynthesis polyprenyl glycosylphosphotransferase
MFSVWSFYCRVEHAMAIVNKKEPIILAFGDIIVLIISLTITFGVRYFEVPSYAIFSQHIVPFSIIFVYSIVIYYIAGLYGKRLAMVRGKIPGTILKSQIVGGLLAVTLFYFIPSFNVTPKLNLLIYSVISSGLLIGWRFWTFSLLSKRRRYRALVIGSGEEIMELSNEIDRSTRSAMSSAGYIDLSKSGETHIRGELDRVLKDQLNPVTHIIADLRHPALRPLMPEIYQRAFPDIRLVDIHDFYEEMFDRIPLSSMTYEWVLEHISPDHSTWYDWLKRAMDIFLSLIIAIPTAIIHPFVWLIIKMDDGGPAIIVQERVGRAGKIFRIAKYRSMNVNDGGKWLTPGDNRHTRVGKFLRKSRIDELPQIVSVLKGDLSLIGPRPDIKNLGDELEKTIPYYRTRTVIKPGLSGWAQINQDKPPQSVEETRLRLSYDLFYIKNRSLGLDIRIALRTIRTLLSRAGI